MDIFPVITVWCLKQMRKKARPAVSSQHIYKELEKYVIGLQIHIMMMNTHTEKS